MEPTFQMKLIFPFLLWLCFFPQFSFATRVQLCDETAEYDITVKGVEISPSPIVRGHPTNMTFNLLIGNPIIAGKMVVDISYFGWHIYSDSHDICVETSCPYLSGDFALPPLRTPLAFFLPGSYHMQITIVDGDDNKLTCFGFDYELVIASLFGDS
ncbi:putative phosphatidylglycerol/phosphatidylinositol transfer protein [Cucumis melo var. makuwa]|uniref:MD-2-related lipid-recognition domain-containing protein n=2 Tax=Cucumis melo TaxID=3656 RepID=A0A9I9CWH2_CUCME|nr:putative phosphatidylglycerol/phosphatidylinositol transfer protein [Cucumis melo var. makuwa]